MIPSTFNWIWISDNPIPPVFIEYRQRWLELHPGWGFHVWDDEKVQGLIDSGIFINTEAYQKATVPAQKCDVLCVELLYHFGGVYLDADMEPRKNIERLLGDEDLVAASEDGYHVSGGFMAATPHHPAFREMIAELPASIHRNKAQGLDLPYQSGPKFRTPIFNKYAMKVWPPWVAYPYPWDQPWRADEPFPGAYMVHRWAKSWSSA